MIEIKNLTKEIVDEYGAKKIIFKNLCFDIKDKEITTVIAPLGAGKSSLLKIISGIDKNYFGEIIDTSYNKIFLITPELQIIPWLSTKENILFSLDNFDENKYNEIIETVGLDGYENHIPHFKSYGFKLRILLAQALMRGVSVVLLDEPFLRMDHITRLESYKFIKSINKNFDIAFLLATTNITEALFLSDTIFLMKRDPGEIIRKIKSNFRINENISVLTSQEFILLREEIINSYKKLDHANILSDLIV